MTFVPKKNKYTKQFKGKIFNQIYSNSNLLTIGMVGLKITEYGIICSTHFETIRQSIRKIIKKAGRIIFLKFPQIPKTKKPLAMRMGKGKGNVDRWICKLQPGMIICELNITNMALAIKALKTAKYRLPIKSKIIFDN